MKDLPIISRAKSFGDAIAYRSGESVVSYKQLVKQSSQIAGELLREVSDLEEARVAFLVSPGGAYTSVQWGIWRAGGVCVPLCLSATLKEWEYVLTDSAAELVVVSLGMEEKLRPLVERLEKRLIVLESFAAYQIRKVPELEPSRRAMILYTSGTTNLPKGVVSTHSNIQAQIESLLGAWAWSSSDCIPLFLPLHHIHGIINVVSCALWAGAMIESYSRFDLSVLLPRVGADAYTVFMAVPTIYVKLIQALEGMSDEERALLTTAFSRLRLMVSGSAALPASVHKKWTALTGQRLLERYGMTEIGMALSNPYEGERRAGSVGLPLPNVAVRLKSEAGELVSGEGVPGEIQVKGPAVFLEYWNRPEATRESFDRGWFRTGDVAVRENSYFRIMGRLSVDIIKSGGYKLSALEIEAVLLEHSRVKECAVMGVMDEVWGEAVAAAIVLNDSGELDLIDLRDWCRERMSVYKIPQRLAVVKDLPRNAMGKVTKPALKPLFDAGD